ncbi:MAG: aminoacyl-tRNA hydrolase [Hyphomicrobiales bacterium]
MILLVGLGNPGTQYAGNRHNIGFHTVDDIHSRHGFAPWRDRFQGQIAAGAIDGEKVTLLKPSTYMNESGRAVGEAVRFFKIQLEDIIVFYDELDLAPGKVRVKTGGGAGGHNGIRSIDAHIGKEYQRVRIGIGHPGHKDLVSRYVLSDFAKSDAVWLGPLITGLSKTVPVLLKDGPSNFLNKLALSQQATASEAPDKPARQVPRKSSASVAKDKDNKTKTGPMAAALKALLPKTKKD